MQTNQATSRLLCTCLGEAFKGSPTYKQIQTRPDTGGSSLGEPRQTLQQINYRYLAKQRSEGVVVDVLLGFLGGL